MLNLIKKGKIKMKTKEDSYKKGLEYTADMIEAWKNENLDPCEAIYGSLSMMIANVFKCAPSEEAAIKMIGVCFQYSGELLKLVNNSVDVKKRENNSEDI